MADHVIPGHTMNSYDTDKFLETLYYFWTNINNTYLYKYKL